MKLTDETRKALEEILDNVIETCPQSYIGLNYDKGTIKSKSSEEILNDLFVFCVNEVIGLSINPGNQNDIEMLVYVSNYFHMLNYITIMTERKEKNEHVIDNIRKKMLKDLFNVETIEENPLLYFMAQIIDDKWLSTGDNINKSTITDEGVAVLIVIDTWLEHYGYAEHIVLDSQNKEENNE